MNKHVPDLERCKKLKELGVEFPECEFYFRMQNGKLITYQEARMTWTEKGQKEYASPAPLVSEMLEVTRRYRQGQIHITTDSVIYVFYDDAKTSLTFPIGGGNHANPIAAILIYLKENKHI
jgi:hypothetical protein